MLDRLIQNRLCLVQLASKNKEVDKLILTGPQWDGLISIKEVLRYFKDITDIMCPSEFPSISILKPVIENITKNILAPNVSDNAQTKKIKESILEYFNTRIKEYQHIDTLLK